jgi:hypothetical protein
MTLTQRRKLLKRLNDYIFASEPGLVVCWFDIVKTLIFTAAIWVCLSPLLDAFYLYVNANSSGFYANTDIEFTSSAYNFWRYIPIITVGFVLFYAINYSNWKRNE